MSTMRDTAMTELEPLPERGPDSAGRKLGLFAIAFVLVLTAGVALAVLEGGSHESDYVAEGDPLAHQLGELGDPKAAAAKGRQQTVELTRVELARLSFPDTLMSDGKARPSALRGQLAARPSADATEIPASTLASEQSERLQRAARHDPLVAQAMPERGGPIAPPGSEGAFNLQVVTYETRDPAERFADALRARGHRAYLAQADVPGRGRYFRVRVGPFTTRREAIEYQRRFEQSEGMHTLVVLGRK